MNETKISLTVKTLARDGSWQTVKPLIDEIIKTSPHVSELNIEVDDVYNSKSNVGNVNHGCNIASQVVNM